MNAPRNTQYRTLCAALLAPLFLAGAAFASDSLKSMVVKSLGGSNYALYAPFQKADPANADYPSTVLARGRDFDGDSIDIPVAHWSNAYNAIGIVDFRPEKAVVLDGPDRITENKVLEPNLGLKILSFFNLTASAKQVLKVTLEFGGTQRRYQVDEVTFNKLRAKVTPDFEQVIRFRIAKNQSKGLMVLIRAVSTDKLKYTLSTSSKVTAELTLKELEKISAKLKDTSLSVKLDASNDTDVVVEVKGEFLIAYQAIRWEDSILSTLKSPPPIDLKPLELTADQFAGVFGN